MPFPVWFKCRKCGNVPNCPMLTDEVWKSVSDQVPITDGMIESGLAHDLLCVACVEELLGRELRIRDLRDCIGNEHVKLFVARLVRDYRYCSVCACKVPLLHPCQADSCPIPGSH